MDRRDGATVDDVHHAGGARPAGAEWLVGGGALGDLVLWDNRTTMHRRDAFDPRARRVMHRTQIKGSATPKRATRV